MRPSLALICLALLTACSEKPQLTVAEKAKYTIELIADRDECKSYGQMLQAPVIDEKLIEQTYQAAKAAHCIKPSV